MFSNSKICMDDLKNWQDQNYLSLSQAIQQICQFMQQLSESPSGGSESLMLDCPEGTAIAQLQQQLQLSTSEYEVLLLCAAMELVTQFPLFCAAIPGFEQQPYPSFQLAKTLFHHFDWSALTDASPLQHWQLIQIDPNAGRATAKLTLDPPILAYLLGEPSPDAALQGIVYPIYPEPNFIFPPSYQSALTTLHQHLTQPAVAPPLMQLQGSDQSSRHQLAAHVAHSLSVPLHQLHPEDLPSEPQLRDRLRRRWERHALLSGAILLIEIEQSSAEFDLNQRVQHQRLIRLISQCHAPIILSSAERLRLGERLTQVIELPKVTTADREALWSRCLGERVQTLNGTLPQIAQQFSLQPQQIVSLTSQLPLPDEPETLPAQLWKACRQAARPHLEDLAQRVTTRLTWDDLIFPETITQQLQSIIAAVRQRSQVYQDWGFAKPEDRGIGIIALFSGLSGTGKTTAAEIIARELALDCYRIDLSNIVNKYIGETEKNLKRVFDAAEGSGAMLLFDEADAVFGMRGEVKEARDRYANQEVSYLLQRLETYPGLVILTSNLRDAIDDAFMRRLRYLIEFPKPTIAERQLIWQRVFPPKVPTEGLHYRRLAELNVTGANIRNIALTAAFLAADRGEPITMALMLQASRAEYNKLGRTLSSTESAALRMKSKP
ncbi:MAG: ATP-binding protein [Cyanobacteria bacterium P01_G01_bin.54]